MHNAYANITMREFKREFTYDDVQVLTLAITYPEVWLPGGRRAQERINGHIRQVVTRYYRYVSGRLYWQAVQEYRNALENDYPFRPYDAVLQYTVTYNENCYLSVYYDKYEYTGGAHGSTLRTSDTYSLENGQRMPLSSFFPRGAPVRKILLEHILCQADEIMQKEPIFFENYRELICKYFTPENYFLTPEGVAIYYQQYEIAPYSTGIPVFVVPYAALGWKPEC